MLFYWVKVYERAFKMVTYLAVFVTKDFVSHQKSNDVTNILKLSLTSENCQQNHSASRVIIEGKIQHFIFERKFYIGSRAGINCTLVCNQSGWPRKCFNPREAWIDYRKIGTIHEKPWIYITCWPFDIWKIQSEHPSSPPEIHMAIWSDGKHTSDLYNHLLSTTSKTIQAISYHI